MSRWRRSSSRYDYGSFAYWPRQPTVAERKASAEREAAKLAKKGETLLPVRIEGRTIARTFWGKAWCTNLERYSDYANRLPRGRSYLSSGQVLDLRVDRGKVVARVMGTSLYTVSVSIDPVPAKQWKEIVRSCAGQIGSMIELLQGKLSKSVMETVTRPGTGLFPTPAEIHLQCSCPDWASMCKHVAASLYGVGARLDDHPELLFLLRGVEPAELVVDFGAARAITSQAKDKALGADTSELADLFGIEIGETTTVSGGAMGRTAMHGEDAPFEVDDEPATGEVTKKAARRRAAPEAAESGATPESGVRRRKAVSATKARGAATVGPRAKREKAPTLARGRSARSAAPLAPEPPDRLGKGEDTGTLVTQQELDARGIDSPIVAYWKGAGLLVAGPKKGTWLATEEAMRRIRRYALKAPARRRRP